MIDWNRTFETMDRLRTGCPVCGEVLRSSSEVVATHSSYDRKDEFGDPLPDEHDPTPKRSWFYRYKCGAEIVICDSGHPAPGRPHLNSPCRTASNAAIRELSR